MPANLPPQYFEIEKKLKAAKTAQEKISILEELLSIVPKHKGTEKLQALLKTKISKLKSTIQKKPSMARHTPLYRVEKSGAAQVVLLGPPNSGKSMLIKSLTNANPEIGEYPYTTRIPFPAMMKYENIQIQLIDTPPVTPDYMESWLPELVKAADGILFLVDLTSPVLIDSIMGIFRKLEEKKIKFVLDNTSVSEEENSFFLKKALFAANKKDLPFNERNLLSLKEFCSGKFNLKAISALKKEGLEELKKRTFQTLEIIRVYSKIPGKKVDFNEPFTLKKGSTVLDMARAVHKDFYQKLKFARIWSKNKYQGQMVNRNHILEDEDILELHI